MTIRKEYEEEDDRGRRRVVVTEESPPETEADETHDDEPYEGEHGEAARSSRAAIMARQFVRLVVALVAIGITVVETLLAFRLGFELAAANRDNNFVEFIFDATGGLVAPFEGIWASRSVDGGVLNPETVIAMVVYLVAAFVLMAIIWALSGALTGYGGEPAHERAAHS